jgi:hypothetical protein
VQTILYRIVHCFGEALIFASFHFAFRPLPTWIIWFDLANSARTTFRVASEAIARASAASRIVSHRTGSILSSRKLSTNSIAAALSTVGRPTSFFSGRHIWASVRSLNAIARTVGTSSRPPPSILKRTVRPFSLALLLPCASASWSRSSGFAPKPCKINIASRFQCVSRIMARFPTTNWQSPLMSAKSTPIKHEGRPHSLLWP